MGCLKEDPGDEDQRAKTAVQETLQVSRWAFTCLGHEEGERFAIRFDLPDDREVLLLQEVEGEDQNQKGQKEVIERGVVGTVENAASRP